MRSRATIICAGLSFNADEAVRLIEATDSLVINYAYMPLVERGIKPKYHLCLDNPRAAGCTEWHRDPSIRSLMSAKWARGAKRWRAKNYLALQMGRVCLDPDINPFSLPYIPKPYKSICAAAQHLTRSGYDRIGFYGSDFFPDQSRWYACSTTALEDKQYRGKCRSTEQMLVALRIWSRWTTEMGCEWVSLSPVSRLNDFLPHQPTEEYLHDR